MSGAFGVNHRARPPTPRDEVTGAVYRVHWKLGTDVLIGVCHCGAVHEAEDPVELWDWLLAHPVGHD